MKDLTSRKEPLLTHREYFMRQALAETEATLLIQCIVC